MSLRVLCAFFVSAGAFAQSSTAIEPSNSSWPDWLRLTGEYRIRAEGLNGAGFKAGADDLFALNRFRLGVSIKPSPWLQVFVQGQDARVFGRDLGPAVPPYQDTADIRQAFIDLGDVEKARFAVRVGRQELKFGEERLIGASNWTNTARTFDAVRGTFRGNAGRVPVRVDVFTASVVNARTGEWNHHQQGNNLHGVNAAFDKLIPKAEIESYVLWRVAPWFVSPAVETGGRAKLDFKTAGVRWWGKLPGHFEYRLSMVRQFGSLGTDTIGAWAGQWRLAYAMTDIRMTPRLVAEYNYATGDANPADGRRGTFDSLYPTAHDKYGLADQVGWRNIHDLRLGTEFKPGPKWLASMFFHDWWLASARDALYSAGGAPIARIASGAAGRHVGEELDAQVSYVLSKHVQFAGGVGHIFPGRFLKAATPGHSHTFSYLMAGYSF